jgi:hypothetical protein
MKNVCTFYDHLEYFTANWYDYGTISLWSFGIFFPFWYVWTKKNLAILFSTLFCFCFSLLFLVCHISVTRNVSEQQPKCSQNHPIKKARQPGAYPTIASYNDSAVKFYNAMGSLVRFENKIIFF